MMHPWNSVAPYIIYSDSTQYRKQLDQGIIDVSVPMITISPGTGGDVDAVTSATEKYYASRV